MEETLLAFAPAILVVAVAVFLRMRRSIREASEETTSLKIRVTTLEQHIRELEWAQTQADEERARNARLHVAALPRPTMAQSLPLTDSQKEVVEVLNQLQVMKAQLPLDSIVEEKYIAELNGIADRLERATGSDLSRWLGIPPQDRQAAAASDNQKTGVSEARIQFRNRDLFRLQIVSLEAFCDYQILHRQLPKGFVPPPPNAAGLIH